MSSSQMSHLAVPDRVRWAMEVLEPEPSDEILEIGCGPGVAAALICGRLETLDVRVRFHRPRHVAS